MTPQQLAGLLAPFGVKPKQLWINGEKTRGYELKDFRDTFARYLPSHPVEAVGSNVCNDLEEIPSSREGEVLPDSIPANSLKTDPLPDLPDEDPPSRQGGTPSLFREKL